MRDLANAISQYFRRVASYDPMVVLMELALIGIVVWWLMRFLRGTRGASLVKGAGVVLALVYLGIRLLPKDRSWERIEFLYGQFLVFAFLAVVVAFQPELRRALAQIGRTRLLGPPRRYLTEEIDALVESAGYLSRNKLGAIMAVQRQVGLNSFLETGTALDAELNAALLNTVFYPGTQLHDMGIIIQNGRVAGAGCQFPLAESDDVDASLGSRHRAALGLAQESDAVVIVVSEETGRISVAMDGQLSVGLDPTSLRELLTESLAPRPRKRAWRQLLHRGSKRQPP